MIGVMNDDFEVVVYTDDIFYIPHVHILDRGTNTREYTKDDKHIIIMSREYFNFLEYKEK